MPITTVVAWTAAMKMTEILRPDFADSSAEPKHSVPILSSHGASYLQETPVALAPVAIGTYSSTPSEPIESHVKEIPIGTVHGSEAVHSSASGGAPNSY